MTDKAAGILLGIVIIGALIGAVLDAIDCLNPLLGYCFVG